MPPVDNTQRSGRLDGNEKNHSLSFKIKVKKCENFERDTENRWPTCICNLPQLRQAVYTL